MPQNNVALWMDEEEQLVPCEWLEPAADDDEACVRLDSAQHEYECNTWGDEASAVWQATYDEVQATWEQMERDVSLHTWGPADLQCCWEVPYAFAKGGRPTKAIKRLSKIRRTKKEIDAGIPARDRAPRVYCTHIALRACHMFPLPRLYKTDASHLCHNPRCVNPAHLVVESRRDNHARKNCVLASCSHSPRCLHNGRWDNH